MEVKQEVSEGLCKQEIHIDNNDLCDVPLDTCKIEIKQEPKRENMYDVSFDYLDLKECPIKTEIEDEFKLPPDKEKQTNIKEYYLLSRKVQNIADLDDDLFINEIKSQKCIWNYRCETYSDRIVKNCAWTAICEKFVMDFDAKTVKEKLEIVKALQKKWKVLRDGFNRYVSKAKKIQSGSGAHKIRQYVHYQQLSFLLALSNDKADTINSLEGEIETDNVLTANSEESTLQRGRKRSSATKEDNLIDQLTENLNRKCKENMSTREVDDDDKLFLLALHGDFKKISDDYKLDAKTEILSVLKKYKELSSDKNSHPNQSMHASH
ncbi:unnamed protein product [Diabrotica balteata]|uniref:MADF domain-containing protein n=1 Tax=Diabrotica balteata TaxID=107213 RepID=A0A9N9SRR6_DIABA|nr:unnamed protein product [Diabrotica balteata]